MLSNRLHVFPAEGFRPATRISFKSEYCGWISFSDKVFFFKFRGQYLGFYTKIWNSQKQETILCKQVDQAVPPTIRSLLMQARKSLFKSNINTERRTILDRPYRLNGDSVEIFSLQKQGFVSLPESSLFAEVIQESHFLLTQAQIDEAMRSLFYVG